jgi:hypothetical protein
MKRFIITNLLAAMVLPMLACAGGWTTNFYLYRIYDSQEFSNRVQKISNDNWKAYLGKSADDWYWFDADEVIKFAQDKGDALMVSYVQNLQKYLDCARSVSDERWEYPTKEELADRNKSLQGIRTYALSKIKSRLRSQHALLYMRCNMLLGKHQENVTFWEETANQYIETVYKDMMMNIYAGALYKTGRGAEAGELFAEMGDYNSLMTQYYKKRSFAAIRQEYLNNPNAKVLPFLLQDFVNNAQEAADATSPDAEGSGNGKLFIRDITKTEALQMHDFCEQVINEGKTTTPIMWKTAKAWLEFMFADKCQATKDILAAASLNGTERMKNCTRSLILYITADQAKDSEAFDNYLTDELKWLDDNPDYNYVRERVLYQKLKKHYASQPSRLLALYKVCGSYEHYAYSDTMQTEQLQKYLYYINTPAKNDLDRYLKAHVKHEPYELEDLIATKYMRICQWEKAITWLKDIPKSFYENRGYVVYAANRSWQVEPWIKRQYLKQSVEYSDTKWQLRNNPKLTFAQEMQKMEGELNVLSGQAACQRYYDLAVRYAQAHFRGDCWWLMRNGKSVDDTLREGESDLAKIAVGLLQKASLSQDPALKERTIFALCYGNLYTTCWYRSVWNSETYKYDIEPDTESPQYAALNRLVDFEASRTPASYVSRCDEFNTFKKLRNI